MGEYQQVRHEFEPVYNRNSRILILGSFPSVKSREQQFYYGHPQNRFWKVIAGLTCYPVPVTIEEKKKMLLENRIAIWDVIAEYTSKAQSYIQAADPGEGQTSETPVIQEIETD